MMREEEEADQREVTDISNPISTPGYLVSMKLSRQYLLCTLVWSSGPDMQSFPLRIKLDPLTLSPCSAASFREMNFH